MGINPEGSLNVPGGILTFPTSGAKSGKIVGLRYIFPDGSEGESTSYGCECEGWGAGADGESLFFNKHYGNSPHTLVNFSSTSDTAVSTVLSEHGYLQVTHDFHPSSTTDNLYEITVTLENKNDAAFSDVIYRRNMDWDIFPTPFSECVTIQPDPSTVRSLVSASNNGFGTSDPYIVNDGISAPFTDFGPLDHGARFDFNFGSLEAGELIQFNIYYGAAETEGAAEVALVSVSAEVYSFGKSSSDGTCSGTFSLCLKYILLFLSS